MLTMRADTWRAVDVPAVVVPAATDPPKGADAPEDADACEAAGATVAPLAAPAATVGAGPAGMSRLLLVNPAV